MLPNKLKNLRFMPGAESEVLGVCNINALLANFLSEIISMDFSVEIIEKENPQAVHLWPQMRKNVQTALRLDVFLSLLRLRPNPRRTQTVF